MKHGPLPPQSPVLICLDIIYKVRGDLARGVQLPCETLFIQVSHENKQTKDILIGVIYRPPGADLITFCNAFTQIISKIANEKKICYFLGDFNIDLLKYESHSGTKAFLDEMFSFSSIH